MTLTLLGTATSQGIPVLGCGCATCISTDPRDKRFRTAALLSEEDRFLAIDAGPDFRSQYLRAAVSRLDGVVVTHEHNDHTAGLDDLRPYCFRQRLDMPVYSLPRVAAELRERFAYAFGNYPGVPRLDLRHVNFGDRLSFAGRELELLEVRHGELPILGFRIGRLAYLTDVKTLPPGTLDRLAGLDTLVISCLNYQGTHSHLSLEETLAYVERLQPANAVLIHLSHRFPPHARLETELPEGVRVGYDGMRLACGNAQ